MFKTDNKTSFPLLTVNHISCSRGDRELFSDLTFSVNVGEVLQVVGPNGSGKTSLLRMLSGLLLVERGEVECCPERIYLGHRLGLKQDFTLAENLRFDLRYQQPTVSEVRSVLAEVGLTPDFHTPCSKLSEGQQQRLALSKLLLSEAKLWILDEPFASLDTDAREAWQQRILNQSKNGGVVFSSHIPLEMPSLKTLELPSC